MSDTATASDDAAIAGAAGPGQPLRKRTAVLVVHGMGSQRALDTVRGLVNAVWLDSDDEQVGTKRYWLHPERKNDDLDLSVITTNEVPGTSDRRSVDFHELYWAHLMSETRAVAVLLWLFELVRKGPRLKTGMRALWWGATIFLCLLVQSVVLLALHGILLLLDHTPLIDNNIKFGVAKETTIWLLNHDYHEPEALLLAPLFVLFMAGVYVTLFSAWRGAWKIALPALVLAAVSAGIFYVGIQRAPGHEAEPVQFAWFTSAFLPILVSLVVAFIAMGRWGVLAMAVTYLSASLFFILYLHSRWLIDWKHDFLDLLAQIWDRGWIPFLTSDWQPFKTVWDHGWLFWSLNERYSAVIAVAILAIYAALYVLFLQPFFGDAARYFRASPANVQVRRDIRKQSVDTLKTLHEWGIYDRIIVVAHSLGTVVAYDMLRAYFSRVNNSLPDVRLLAPEFGALDHPVRDEQGGAETTELRKETFRSQGRAVIRRIAAETVGSGLVENRKRPSWLVTDFVTLGSPLTHAQYLMCDGRTAAELDADFRRRVVQREFPVCPPEAQNGDGLLSFYNPHSGRQEFHHAALFGLTRWTNLFFPMSQLFWGDAVGGPLKEIFGRYVKDVPVSTNTSGAPAFFTHTAYWKTTGPLRRDAPCIAELRRAVNLEDK